MKKDKRDLTQEKLKELLDYFTTTSNFNWRRVRGPFKSPPKRFKQSTHALKTAFTSEQVSFYIRKRLTNLVLRLSPNLHSLSSGLQAFLSFPPSLGRKQNP